MPAPPFGAARPHDGGAGPARDPEPTSRGSSRSFDVVCVGNALMDFLSFADSSALGSLGLAPGGMTLVDVPTTSRIAEAVGVSRRVPGGTVTNTAVGIASFGGSPAFVGAVADDELGDRYAADLEDSGVLAVLERFAPVPGDADAATGRCMVVVTPDAERTMATALGVGGRLDRTGVPPDVLGSSRLVYFDGYLLDLPDAPAIVETIVSSTRAAGAAIALGLADAMLVERHRGTLEWLVADCVDVLFANEGEVVALARRRSVEESLDALDHEGLTTVATLGASGALVSSGGLVIEVPAVHVDAVVDATGAGDLFAAGVCFGYTHGYGIEQAARFGALAAAEVIGHLGARPERSLAALAADAGLL
ncbi:MAG: adenosine kinase [Actinomycetota bacterium]|nr:adenosine kinase [Actinomycetota bacterium]